MGLEPIQTCSAKTGSTRTQNRTTGLVHDGLGSNRGELWQHYYEQDKEKLKERDGN